MFLNGPLLVYKKRKNLYKCQFFPIKLGAAGMFMLPFMDKKYVKIQMKDRINFEEVLGTYDGGIPRWMRNVENRRPAEHYSVYIEMKTGWRYITHDFYMSDRIRRINPLTHIPDQIEARINNKNYSNKEFTTYDVKGPHPNARTLSERQGRLFMAIKGSLEVYTTIIEW